MSSFPGVSAVKNLPAEQETWEEPLAAHSRILAWEVPWTEEPGDLQSRGHKESDTTELTKPPAAHEGVRGGIPV